MLEAVPNIGNLDAIIRDTISAIEASKKQIYDIAEGAREEYRRLERELETVRQETQEIIAKVDEVEARERKARWRLLEVSREFHRYTEEDVRWAYEEAKNAQVELAIHREREKVLRERRDELERYLRNLEETVKKAELLVSQVGVVLDYLGGSLGSLSLHLEGVQQRQELALEVIRAQEEERRRVAREIHDGPAQSMANLVFRIEVCEKLLHGQSLTRLQDELQELKGMIKEGLKDVRKIIFDLRPMALDDLGLVPALRRFLEGFQEREQLEVDLVVLGQEIRLPSALEVGVFRIVQEALNNVVKHARASRVKIAISYSETQLIISVKDNGIGFDLEEVKARCREQGHFGIISMRERAELLRGQLDVQSSRGEGTKIRLTVPIEEEEGGWFNGRNTNSAGR